MAKKVAVLSTVCPACRGANGRLVARAALVAGDPRLHTTPEHKPCRTCHGEGMLAGLMVPV